VKPNSLAGENANTAAFRCLDVLNEFGITDVDVEIRESSVTRSAGPELLSPVVSTDPTAAVRDPLTHALGLPISAEASPDVGGTGGFFMAEGGASNELLLITARHVVLPPSRQPNVEFERKNESQPRFDVLLLGDEAYKSCLASTEAKIEGRKVVVEYWEQRLEEVEEQDDEEANKMREVADGEIKKAKEAMGILKTLSENIKDNWGTYENRVLGHLIYSPPLCLSAGTTTEQFTQDLAVIKVDNGKIDRTKFKGNMIDLGTDIDMEEFTRKMYPNVKNPRSFKYPRDRLLMLRGTISDEDMRRPTSLDQSNEACLMVIKDGAATGVTIGRASGIVSYVRVCHDDDIQGISKEWAILPYDSKSGAFSAPGDSGAVIVDGLGRIGGLLTGGTGGTGVMALDITYASPISFIEKSIKAKYPNAHLNPA
jgi:hypothetical protein